MTNGTTVCAVSISLLIAVGSCFAEEGPRYFDTSDIDAPGGSAPMIAPWKVVRLDPAYSGLWVAAGDLDGDGEVEIVSAENFNEGDVHYTSTAVAQKLDGTVLWRWGDPDIGRKTWHHDVACQIHDWDNDGKNEVVLCTKGFLVELDGATGEERRRFAIPGGATDCLVFCDLSGRGHAGEVLVKNRYRQIWAYNRDGGLLWTSEMPGGYRTSHQPRPIDVDGDGRDEIVAGYAMLNPDGSVRWVFESKAVDLKRGHVDCARVLRAGDTPEEFRIVLTCCGADNIAVVDGNGKLMWEVSGHHFESADVGRVIAQHPGPQIAVDIDHRPPGEGPIWVLGENGEHLGSLMTDYARHHALLDWTGDGVDEIVVARHRAMYGGGGQRIGTFAVPGLDVADDGRYEQSIFVGDMTGDGLPDVLMTTQEAVYIYRNEKGQRPAGPARLGTEFNVTLY